MKKMGILFMSLLLFSFQITTTLKGTWKFVGGIYNGKKEGTPTEYTLERKYNAKNYEAFVLEKGHKPERYEAGEYLLKGDTCIDKETFCSQPSKITNIPIHYLFSLTKDTLTLKGTLPTGVTVEEHWKRIK